MLNKKIIYYTVNLEKNWTNDMLKITPLCKIGAKYGTDKCPQIKHTYTPAYYDLFKDRKGFVKKVFEIGVCKGASVRMWRDFFPKAQIYGLDVREESRIEGERIKTFVGDSRDKKTWEKIFDEIGTDIDLFVDDGSHWPSYQAITCRLVKPLLEKKAIYIIEDVRFPNELRKRLPEFEIEEIATPKKFRDDGLVIVK